jgi:23S rRNA (pseudouridine1915-N3)-methyltransferase
MRIVIFAVGRMKAGPERQLAERYFDRFAKSARAEGIDFGGVLELAESRAQQAEARKADEAARILEKLPAGSTLILLDENGKSPNSEEFAGKLGSWRDSGVKTLAFAIGGPDGHGDAMKENAAATICFGALTWPHQLVRVMLSEQLYRAVTILSGHPYHRS